MQIDPWGPGQVQDYAKLRTEFGLGGVDDSMWTGIERPHPLFERGVVFAHRGLDAVLAAMRRGDAFGLMTGLMPSGKMHFGHKALIDQCIWYQEKGADLHIAIADFEAYAARGFSIPEAQRLGLEEYVLTYLALGLDPKRSEVYYQTKRTRVKDLAYRLGLHVSMRTMRALYGFEDDIKLAHVNAPLMQAGDILHVQAQEFGGPRPILVPVGVDQDPHIRLTRDLAAATRVFSITETKDKRIGVFVKPEKPPKDVKALLDDVERILRQDVGISDLKRNDAYRAIYIDGANPSDVPRMDLALARYEQAELGEPGFFPPSSTYHRFQTGLVAGPDGKPGKMSSSRPETSIFISDDEASIEKKIKRAVTGGRTTVEEQRAKGANPYVCSIYELYLYHLADDKTLKTVFEECTTGKRLCGECKGQALVLLKDQVKDIQEKREASRHLVKEIVSDV
jgi:tryptophanyl-tRNA synthetase